MAILDFLKNKQDAEKSRKAVKKPAKVSVGKTETPAIKSNKVSNAKFSYDAIKQPHISEKATYLAENDQYTFEVLPNYSKQEIKKAIEGIYGVDVVSVHTIQIPSKKRRLGKTEGFRKSYKKAIVKIKEGQKIEIL